MNFPARRSRRKREHPLPDQIDIEAKIARQEMKSSELIASVEQLGKISTLTCPDCNGALWEIDDHEILRYRCHVGHAFSAEALGDGQTAMLEIALWSAIRALEEQMILARKIRERARHGNRMDIVRIFERRAQEAEQYSSMIRQLLLGEEKDKLGEESDKIAEPVLQADD